ncbi:VOC family protein [Devosia salina]|uniref:VOC family protein n=1 Tax=Devosia salina TaxID=2860336 RepID=A0ABX8WH62_9HYPH|nr:VOC family protein [Devosia salina]QYO78209.1 VOC family protein [Devosia salina]
MFSHITVGSNDLVRAGQFYDAVLTPLGLRRRPVEPDGGPEALCWVGGVPYPRFYVYAPFDGQAATPGNGAMLAFIAPSRAAVDAAYAAGMAAGGRDEGAPGLRSRYAPDYYGAYLRDPDGNKVHLVHRDELLA